MTILPLAEDACVLSLGTNPSQKTFAQIQAMKTALEVQPFAGLWGLVPAYTTLTVYFDPLLAPSEAIRKNHLKGLWQRIQAGEATKQEGKLVEIPVVYDGLDLPALSAFTGLSKSAIIEAHIKPRYLVYFIGFMAGFPYLEGLDERLFMARHAAPRLRVPAGSVGIGGNQTGIYPYEAPGGWQLIGRTALSLFDPYRQPASLLQAGDRVRFIPL